MCPDPDSRFALHVVHVMLARTRGAAAALPTPPSPPPPAAPAAGVLSFRPAQATAGSSCTWDWADIARFVIEDATQLTRFQIESDDVTALADNMFQALPRPPPPPPPRTSAACPCALHGPRPPARPYLALEVLLDDGRVAPARPLPAPPPPRPRLRPRRCPLPPCLQLLKHWHFLCSSTRGGNRASQI